MCSWIFTLSLRLASKVINAWFLLQPRTKKVKRQLLRMFATLYTLCFPNLSLPSSSFSIMYLPSLGTSFLEFRVITQRTLPQFYFFSCWDSNSGPQAYWAGTCVAELCPWLVSFLLNTSSPCQNVINDFLTDLPASPIQIYFLSSFF